MLQYAQRGIRRGLKQRDKQTKRQTDKDKKRVVETDTQINRQTEGWKASNKRYQIWTASKGGWVTDSSVVENYIRTELLLLFMKGSKWKKSKERQKQR